ncbi:MAG TPA: ABC transporter permease [Clostridia bacterium]|nr:ABC transporter permease [Clostridia bacterium]
MMGLIKKGVDKIGFPRMMIFSFLILLTISVPLLNIPFQTTLSQAVVRIGINIVLALAMVPSIMCGTGMNYALPIGIECGLVAGIISCQYNMTGVGGILAAIAISVPMSIVAGLAYSKLINRVKGSEMIVSTYVGFSIVSIMCITWIVLPFDNPAIVWPIGKGLRTTITLESWYDGALNKLGMFNIFGVQIPTGLIALVSIICFAVWLFMRSRLGIRMKAAGSNPRYARSNGVEVDRMRTLGTIISTVLGGVGIIIYAQGFGFYQLYTAPLMMAFPAIAAVLIGGATPSKVSIFNVILGSILFQGMLVLATPVANVLITAGNFSEVVRTLVMNGMILYALAKMQGGGK